MQILPTNNEYNFNWGECRDGIFCFVGQGQIVLDLCSMYDDETHPELFQVDVYTFNEERAGNERADVMNFTCIADADFANYDRTEIFVYTTRAEMMAKFAELIELHNHL